MSSDIDPKRLWLRVLYVGLVDAYECLHDDNIFKSTDDLDWLTSSDFIEVCDYCDVNPDHVRGLIHDEDAIQRLRVMVSWVSVRDMEQGLNPRAYTRASEGEAIQIGLFG